MPQVRGWARQRRIHVEEVDLRTTEEETNSSAATWTQLSTRLAEVDRCDIFIAIVGDRYGWAPRRYGVRGGDPALTWIRRYPRQRSFLELECARAFLNRPPNRSTSPCQALVYMREDEWLETIPVRHRPCFADGRVVESIHEPGKYVFAADPQKSSLLQRLRSAVRASADGESIAEEELDCHSEEDSSDVEPAGPAGASRRSDRHASKSAASDADRKLLDLVKTKGSNAKTTGAVGRQTDRGRAAQTSTADEGDILVAVREGYHCRYDVSSHRVTELQPWVDLVVGDLIESIAAQFPDTEAPRGKRGSRDAATSLPKSRDDFEVDKSAVYVERARHAEFAAHRARGSTSLRSREAFEIDLFESARSFVADPYESSDEESASEKRGKRTAATSSDTESSQELPHTEAMPRKRCTTQGVEHRGRRKAPDNVPATVLCGQVGSGKGTVLARLACKLEEFMVNLDAGSGKGQEQGGSAPAARAAATTTATTGTASGRGDEAGRKASFRADRAARLILPGRAVIAHFVGSSARADNARLVLQRLCRELRVAYQVSFAAQRERRSARRQRAVKQTANLLRAAWPGDGMASAVLRASHARKTEQRRSFGARLLVAFATATFAAGVARRAHTAASAVSEDLLDASAWAQGNSPPPSTFRALRKLFHGLLAAVCTVSHLVLLVDGCDELASHPSMAGDPGRLGDDAPLSWLPALDSLHPNLRIILSAHGDATQAAGIADVRSRDALPALIAMGAVPASLPPLAAADAGVLFRESAKSAGKEVSEEQVTEFASHPEATLPLFVSSVCAEIRGMDHHEASRFLAELPDTLDNLLDGVLRRSERSNGVAITADATCLLACAPEGLTEAEIAAMLHVPPHRWATIRQSISAYLRFDVVDDDAPRVRLGAAGRFCKAVSTRYLHGGDPRATSATMSALEHAARDPHGPTDPHVESSVALAEKIVVDTAPGAGSGASILVGSMRRATPPQRYHAMLAGFFAARAYGVGLAGAAAEVRLGAARRAASVKSSHGLDAVDTADLPPPTPRSVSTGFRPNRAIDALRVPVVEPRRATDRRVSELDTMPHATAAAVTGAFPLALLPSAAATSTPSPRVLVSACNAEIPAWETYQAGKPRTDLTSSIAPGVSGIPPWRISGVGTASTESRIGRWRVGQDFDAGGCSALRVLPAHLLAAGLVSEAANVLGDLAYIEAMARIGAVHDVVDLATLLHVRLCAEIEHRHPGQLAFLLPGSGGVGGSSGGGLPCNERVARALGNSTLTMCTLAASIGAILAFVRRFATQLHAIPRSTFQLAASQPAESLLTILAEDMWNARVESRPLLHWINRPDHPDPCVLTLRAPTSAPVTSLAFSPDGAVVAMGTAGGYIYLWNCHAGIIQRTLQIKEKPRAVGRSSTGTAGDHLGTTISAMAFRPEDDRTAARWLLVGTERGEVHLWNVRTERSKEIYRPHAFEASETGDGSRGLANLLGRPRVAGSPMAAPQLSAHDHAVTCVAWRLGNDTEETSNPYLLLTADAGGVAAVWEMSSPQVWETGKLGKAPRLVAQWQAQASTVTDAAFGSNNWDPPIDPSFESTRLARERASRPKADTASVPTLKLTGTPPRFTAAAHRPVVSPVVMAPHRGALFPSSCGRHDDQSEVSPLLLGSASSLTHGRARGDAQRWGTTQRQAKRSGSSSPTLATGRDAHKLPSVTTTTPAARKIVSSKASRSLPLSPLAAGRVRKRPIGPILPAVSPATDQEGSPGKIRGRRDENMRARHAKVSGCCLVITAGGTTLCVWRVSAGDGEVVKVGRASGQAIGVHTGDAGVSSLVKRSNMIARIVRSDGERVSLSGADGRGMTRACFSESADRVAVVCDDTTLRVFRTDTGRAVGLLRGHVATITCAAYSPGGRTIASGSVDGVIRLWVPQLVPAEPGLAHHTGPIVQTLFSPFSTDLRALTVSLDGTARMWSMETNAKGKLRCLHRATFELPAGKPLGAAFSLGGSTLSVGCPGGVRLWPTAANTSSSSRASLSRNRDDGRSGSDGAATGYSAGTSSSTPGSLSMGLQILNPVPIAHVGRGLRLFAASPDGSVVALVRADGEGGVRLVDVASGLLRSRVAASPGHAALIRAMAFSPDGRCLLTADASGNVCLWDVAVPLRYRAHMRSLPQGQAATPELLEAAEHEAPSVSPIAAFADPLAGSASDKNVEEICWSSDGKRVLVRAEGADVRLYNMANICSALTVGDIAAVREQRCVSKLSGHSGRVSVAKWSPDGCSALTASNDGTVRIWDVKACDERIVLVAHDGAAVTHALYDATGERLATCGTDNSIRVWSVESGERLAIWTVGSPVLSLACDPYMNCLAVGDESGRCIMLRLVGVAHQQRRAFVAMVRNFLSAKDEWHPKTRAPCPNCGSMYQFEHAVLGVVSSIERSVETLGARDGLVSDPRLKFRCNTCKIGLRLTPGASDNPLNGPCGGAFA